MKQRIYIDTSAIGGYCDREFDTVAFFRAVKEKMAKATEGMSLQEKREYWKQLREGTKQLTVEN